MTAPMEALRAPQVVLALGSNLGDRLHNLQGALDALFDTGGLVFVVVSPVYETAPVGGPAQPDYLNAVVLARSWLPPRVILERGQAAEAAFERVRGEAWGPRTLDVDLIVYGDEVSNDPELTLPHPRAHERAFVLAPWLDVDPDAFIPGRGRVAALLKAVGLAGVRRLDDSVLQSPI
jgi:2-amino-4-hydroxy-6-hydroxymethyldihydropteridine diphosphokinase